MITTHEGTSIDMHPNKNNNNTRTMSLEERVRARAALRQRNAAHRAKSTAAQSGTRGNEKKALLELADALRHFSQRRGVSFRGDAGTPLHRLQSRVGGAPSSAAHRAERVVSARLAVADFLNDARLCWNGILRNSVGSGGGGSASFSRGADSRGMSSSSSVVHVDLGRVLFQLRLNMTYDSNHNAGVEKAADGIASDRRRMEKYLLNLLQELTVIVPHWISVSRIPASSSAVKRKGSESSANGASARGVDHAKSIIARDSIIIIRNDTVDYNADVRSKLGGKTAGRVDSGSRKRTAEGHSKGPSPISTKLHGNSRSLGPWVVADAIVPPSFRRRYGKVIESACVAAATKRKDSNGVV